MSINGDSQPLAEQEGNTEIHEGDIEPVTGQEGDTEPVAVQEGDAEPVIGQEGDTEPVTVHTEPVIGLEGDTEPATVQKGDTEPSIGQEDATKPVTRQEEDTEPVTVQEGDAEPATGQEGDTEPATVQKGDTEPSTGQEDATKPVTGQEDDTELVTVHEGDAEPATVQEDDTEPVTGQEGNTEPVTGEDDKEPVVTGVAEPSAVDEETAEKTSANEQYGEQCESVDRVMVQAANASLEDITEEEEVYDRECLLDLVEEELIKQEQLSSLKAQLEHKIAEYLIARKKTEERSDPGRSVTDQEKRYAQCMAALEQLKVEMRDIQEAFQQQEQILKVLREEKLALVKQASAEFADYKKGQALTAVRSRNGKRITVQELDEYQVLEDRKEEEVIVVRLENIKLQNKIVKLEALIREKDQLAEGLHMIDFEQLKINNVDLNEKIEERNEDILKLRRKVTSTVQVLTHVKEKLQFLQTENVKKGNALADMDTVVAKSRDHLTRMKQARDSLRMDNNRLRQQGGLVAHKTLLRDYEECEDQNQELSSRLEALHKRHSELSIICEGIQRKIERAKAVNTYHT